MSTAFTVQFTDPSVEKFLNSFKVTGLVEWQRHRGSLRDCSDLAASLSTPLGGTEQLQSFPGGGALRDTAELLDSGPREFRRDPTEPNILL